MTEIGGPKKKKKKRNISKWYNNNEISMVGQSSIIACLHIYLSKMTARNISKWYSLEISMVGKCFMHAQTHFVSRQKGKLGSRKFMLFVKYLNFETLLFYKNSLWVNLEELFVLGQMSWISLSIPLNEKLECKFNIPTKRSNQRKVQSNVPLGLLLILPPNGKQVQ